MKRALVLTQKELHSWLYTPALYGIAFFFLAFVSIWFYYFQRFFAMNTASFRSFFAGFPLAFVLVIPALTMKSWTDEKKHASIDLLFSLPFTECELVLGKFLASFTILSVFIILTLPVPLSIVPLGNFDTGVIIAEYFGCLLLGAAACALGQFLSSICKTQAAAFLGTAVILLAMTLLNTISSDLPAFLARFINSFSLVFHFESFSRGILDSRDIAFFLLASGLFLFLNVQSLVIRKWM